MKDASGGAAKALGRGQALVEYSALTWLLLAALLLGAGLEASQDGGPPRSLAPVFSEGLQRYLDAYWVLLGMTYP